MFIPGLHSLSRGEHVVALNRALTTLAEDYKYFVLRPNSEHLMVLYTTANRKHQIFWPMFNDYISSACHSENLHVAHKKVFRTLINETHLQVSLRA